jgi:hypothetical protein
MQLHRAIALYYVADNKKAIAPHTGNAIAPSPHLKRDRTLNPIPSGDGTLLFQTTKRRSHLQLHRQPHSTPTKDLG